VNDELQRLRAEIDNLDTEMLALVSRRAQLASRIGGIKQGNIYRPEREAQVLRRLGESNPGPLPEAAVYRIFREVMSACLALEQPLNIAYLGPAGTFSESAVRKHFGSAPTLLPLAAIDDVYRAVEAGNAHYGVVPVENSTEGAIGRTLDLLLAGSLEVCGEVQLRIHQNMMSKAASLAGLKRLYSHAQSLAQCHGWLNRNAAQLQRVPVASNAEAARMAADDAEACAIAGEAAAALYGLQVLASNIEDDPNNTTRFVVIGEHDAGPSGLDKTSIVFSVPNQAGAVLALLEPLSRHGVSMTRFESRPARGLGASEWKYVFFVDLEGHRSDPPVAAALTEMRAIAGFLKVLGSYPRAAA
jgi:chorismate mutase/prephenate dehydratase